MNPSPPWVTVSLIAMACTAPGCAALQRKAATSAAYDRDAIHALMSRRENAGSSGDADAWVACFTDDAVIMPSNAAAVIGKPAIYDWERSFEGFRPHVDVNIDELVVQGNWAYIRSTIVGEFIKNGEAFRIDGKELAILKRVDGQWKFHRICGNKNAGSRFEKRDGN